MPYRRRFFEAIADESLAAAKIVLPVVFELAGRPQSMLDVGCGTGSWLAAASDLGVADVLGVDGHAPVDQLRIPIANFRRVDLGSAFELGRRFDLVTSLEVAEHLPAAAAEPYVESIARHGDLVLFSAAIPGQGGEDHINERPASYWVRVFGAHEFELFDVVRPRIWDDERVAYYYRQDALLFARGPAADRLRAAEPGPALVDVVHPGTLATYSESGVRFATKLALGAVGRTARRRFGHG